MEQSKTTCQAKTAKGFKICQDIKQSEVCDKLEKWGFCQTLNTANCKPSSLGKVFPFKIEQVQWQIHQFVAEKVWFVALTLLPDFVLILPCCFMSVYNFLFTVLCGEPVKDHFLITSSILLMHSRKPPPLRHPQR